MLNFAMVITVKSLNEIQHPILGKKKRLKVAFFLFTIFSIY